MGPQAHRAHKEGPSVMADEAIPHHFVVKHFDGPGGPGADAVTAPYKTEARAKAKRDSLNEQHGVNTQSVQTGYGADRDSARKQVEARLRGRAR